MKALKTKFTTWTLAGLTIALLSACGAQPQAVAPKTAPAPAATTAAPAPAATTAPVQPTAASAPAANVGEAQAVVERFVATLNAGDQAGLRAMFTPNGQVSYAGSSPMQGAAIDSWLQSDIFGVQGRIENPTYTMNGNQVTLRGQYRSNGWSGNANYIFTVENEMIAVWELR